MKSNSFFNIFLECNNLRYLQYKNKTIKSQYFQMIIWIKI